MSELKRRVATCKRWAALLEILQYGVTRERLERTVEFILRALTRRASRVGEADCAVCVLLCTRLRCGGGGAARRVAAVWREDDL